MLTVPVELKAAPIVSVVPVIVTPLPEIAAELVNVPLEPANKLKVPEAVRALETLTLVPVRETLPLKVSEAVVVIAPAEDTVKLLTLVRDPIARAVVPLPRVTLLTA